MLFHSVEFLAFFIFVVVAYFLLPVAKRWILVLVASYLFYMYWNPWYIVLLLTSTLVDYFAALKMSQHTEDKIRKRYLYFSLVANLGMLGFFKYFNFFAEQFAWIIKLTHPDYNPVVLSILLPVGISFYTFQTLGYTIDVYKKRIAPVTHLGTFAIYVCYFPQLVAGPIERAKDLIPQLHFNYNFDTQRVTEGMRLFLWGLFKKVVLADRIGLYVAPVFATPGVHTGGVAWLAAALFAFQIYLDFSAYQDMALGSSRVLGIRLTKNFENLVVFRNSFQKFWQGWHITLTNWIRDYAFQPLVGKSRNKWRFFFSLILLFVIIGFWHGAQWTFIIWGLIHGIFITVERLLLPLRRRGKKAIGEKTFRILSGVLLFNLFCLTLYFFRNGSLSDSLTLLKSVFVPVFPTTLAALNPFMENTEFLIIWPLLAVVIAFEYFNKHKETHEFLNFRQPWLRWTFYLLIINAILFLRIPKISAFIYFEF